MSINAKRISKVIIAGDWFTVTVGTFQVVEMEFLDESGSPMHQEPLGAMAYTFMTDNKDVYYGPLSAIELFKLVDV